MLYQFSAKMPALPLMAQDTTTLQKTPPVLMYKPLPLGMVSYRLGEQAIKPKSVYQHLKHYQPEAARDFRAYRRMRTTGAFLGAGFVALMIPEMSRPSSFSDTNGPLFARRATAIGLVSASLIVTTISINRLHRSMHEYNESYGHKNYRRKLPWWKSFLILSIY